MNKQVKININDKVYYCDMEVLKLIERLQDKIELLEYNDISTSEKPKIPKYHGDMFIDVEAEYLMRKKFQQIIDKAIEYINYCLEENCEDSGDYLDNTHIGEKLISILKGSEE